MAKLRSQMVQTWGPSFDSFFLPIVLFVKGMYAIEDMLALRFAISKVKFEKEGIEGEAQVKVINKNGVAVNLNKENRVTPQTLNNLSSCEKKECTQRCKEGR